MITNFRRAPKVDIPGPPDPVLAAEVGLLVQRWLYGGPEDVELFQNIPHGPVWTEVSRQLNAIGRGAGLVVDEQGFWHAPVRKRRWHRAARLRRRFALRRS